MKPNLILLTAAIALAAALPACRDSNARGVSFGASGIENHEPLHVRIDRELKARVDAALDADGNIKAEAITVCIRKGAVTLIGVVPPEQIIRADLIARHIPGVRAVTNALRPVLPVS